MKGLGVEPAGVSVRLLGTVQLLIDGADIPVAGAKQRALLVMLALEAGAVVSVDRLIDGIWGNNPPTTVRSGVHVYVAQLRRLLATHGFPNVIETRPSGYLLAIDPEHVDARWFAATIDAASRPGDGQLARVASAAREALPRWSGDTLGGLDGVAFAPPVRVRLDAERLSAVELMFAHELDAADHQSAIPELMSWAERYPYREHLWQLLIFALYRNERQVEALGRLETIRRVLADELGLQIGPMLAELELRILQHDPTLMSPAPLRVESDAEMRTNLRRPAVSLFGIENQRAALQGLLQQGQLVTVVGPGGIGKTRLATDVGWNAIPNFADGVWVVDLSSVSDPEDVALACAATWSIATDSILGALEATIDWLGNRSLLVIVDNCEHVLDEAARVIAEVVGRCPNVTVIATSRERLGVSGERCYAVQPLDPATSGFEMFIERARLLDPMFGNGDHRDVIVEICRQLDGMPLAIELASARTLALSPPELLERLSDRFSLLKGRSRDGSDRHRTLLAMVNWSYRLLTDDERLVLNRSSVFAGGFDLRALDEVCLDGAGGPTDTAAADRIESLVAKSMVVAMPDGDGTRYMLLETIRQFAHERLHVTGEVSTTRDRHLAHFVATADHFDEISNGPRQVEGYEHFRREWGNLRAAFGWALAARNVSACMALLRSCSLFAHCAVVAEFGEWAERLVALDSAERPLPTEAFGFAAEWAQTRADDDLAYEQFSAGVSRASRPDHPGTARCWWVGTFRNPGRVSTSAALDNYRNLRQAVANTPDIERQWLALVDLVDATFRLDHAAFQADLQRLSALSEHLASPSLQIYTALYRGHGRLAEVPTNFEEATADYSEALRLAESVGDLRGAGMAQRGLVIVSVGVGADDALSRCHDTISSLYDNRFWQKLWQVLDSTAAALLMDADIESAAVIVGHLAAHVPAVGVEALLEFRSNALQRIHAHPQGPAWMRRGAALRRDQLVAFALQATVTRPAPRTDQSANP